MYSVKVTATINETAGGNSALQKSQVILLVTKSGGWEYRVTAKSAQAIQALDGVFPGVKEAVYKAAEDYRRNIQPDSTDPDIDDVVQTHTGEHEYEFDITVHQFGQLDHLRWRYITGLEMPEHQTHLDA